MSMFPQGSKQQDLYEQTLLILKDEGYPEDYKVLTITDALRAISIAFDSYLYSVLYEKKITVRKRRIPK